MIPGLIPGCERSLARISHQGDIEKAPILG